MKPVLYPMLLLLASISTAISQPRFEVPLTVTDEEVTWTIYFGILPGGHFCIDFSDSMNGHFESERGPWPPASMEAWFVWPRSGSSSGCFGIGSGSDYRPFTSYVQRDTFRVNVDTWGNPTLTVSWPPRLSEYFSELTLRDVATNGVQHTVDMLSTTSVNLGDVSPSHFRIYSSGPCTPNDTITVGVHIQPGWNMVSNPVITANDSLPLLFPICLGCPVWWPPPGYIDSCRLHHGSGRWVKCPAGGNVSITGMPVVTDIIPVATGWNIVGSLSYPIATSSVSSVPPNIVMSRFFGYMPGSGYMRVDTLQPGSSYWVKTNQAGYIVLSSSF